MSDIIVRRIKELRAKSGLTQQQLAFDTGMSVAAIQSIEGGRAKPNIESLTKIADRFGCTTDYLLGRTDSPNQLIVETWDDFHDFMNMLVVMAEVKDVNLADRIRKSLSLYPVGKETIPPNKETMLTNVLKTTMEAVTEVSKRS